MTIQKYFILAVTFLLLTPLASPAAKVGQSPEGMRLKPGATGELCLGCHTAFKETLQQASVHTPLKKKNCTGCHSPHASDRKKLLAADQKVVCFTCHPNLLPANAVSTHSIASEGHCIKCHDPHAAPYQNNLIKSGDDLCAQCHAELKEKAAKAKFKHAPVAKGCASCHDPHASTKGPALLKADVPSLCLGCHKPDRPNFSKQHMNYPVTKSRCTDCHDPHGSDLGGILYNTVHKPVATRMCGQCHGDASGATITVKKAGTELCKSCHAPLIKAIAAKNRIHWPVVAGEGCLTCHGPHASREPKLLKAKTINLCGRCHKDTILRQERSLSKHEPIQKGECAICHDPHSGDQVFSFKEEPVSNLCNSCHDWQQHSTHPLGDDIKDPRNGGSVQCLSCHRSHGTEFKKLIPFAKSSELCTQCHEKYKR
jgi:predicted CXXCH cytochrome family protein